MLPSGARLWSSMPFFFYSYGDHRALHSFPTRRSSDLLEPGEVHATTNPPTSQCCAPAPPILEFDAAGNLIGGAGAQHRSEEHTSELQSQSNLVCRLLLEKKKTKLSTTKCTTAHPVRAS